MDAPEVLAKKQAAETWCNHASKHTQTHSGKPRKYILIPHTAIANKMALVRLEKQYSGQ